MAPMLVVEDLGVAYGRRQVLDGMAVTVDEGEIVALLGPTGCGKTTLLRAISGVTPFSSGQVTIEGKPASAFGRKALSRRIAVVPQSPPLPVGFTTEEVVLMGRTPHLRFFEQEGPKDHQCVRLALEQVGAGDLAARTIEHLSGGERQKVALARCLAQAAPILLLDEPTAHLDIAHQIAVAQLVKRLARDRHLAVLAAMHDLTLAALYCDRLILMHAGKALADGTPDAVLTEANVARVYGTSIVLLRDPAIPAPVVMPYTLSTPNDIDALPKAAVPTSPAGQQLRRASALGQPRRRDFALKAIPGEFLMAVKILTRFPCPTLGYQGTGAAAFGLVGAGLGILAALPVMALGQRLSLLAGALAVAVLALASGALHLDGLADTFDALAAVNREAAERARKDPRIGPAGATALVLVVGIDIICIAALARTPTLSVWGLVTAAATSRGVAAIGAPWVPHGTHGFGAWFARRTSRVAALVAAFITMGLASAGGRIGIAALVAGGAMGATMLVVFSRHFAVIGGDAFGAAIELAFAAALVVEVVVTS